MIRSHLSFIHSALALGSNVTVFSVSTVTFKPLVKVKAYISLQSLQGDVLIPFKLLQHVKALKSSKSLQVEVLISLRSQQDETLIHL